MSGFDNVARVTLTGEVLGQCVEIDVKLTNAKRAEALPALGGEHLLIDTQNALTMLVSDINTALAKMRALELDGGLSALRKGRFEKPKEERDLKVLVFPKNPEQEH